MSEVVAELLQGLDGLHLGVLYLLAGLFTALETSVGIGLLIPGDSVVLLAGTTATKPHRFAALVAATVLGSLTGESIGYLLGRRYGTRLRTSRVGRRLGEHRWAAAEAFLAGRGGRAVAAARFVALVHALVPVVAGRHRRDVLPAAGQLGCWGRGGLVDAVCGDRRCCRRVLAAIRRPDRPGRPGRVRRRARNPARGPGSPARPRTTRPLGRPTSVSTVPTRARSRRRPPERPSRAAHSSQG
jgi:membrane protein YqaA with SNARE-associated domain